MTYFLVALGATLVTASGTMKAQTAALPKPLTLPAAISYAQRHYPAIRASLERVNAAKANVGLAKANYLPAANMLWQSNRATRNNIFGLLLPQSVVPSISGPVLPTADNTGVWGSAAGVLASWEPFDFGYRQAVVNSARANQGLTEAENQLTQLDIAAMTAAAFFDLAAAREAVSATKADLDRRQTFFNSVHVLVHNELRPGAEESRANAEFAAARIRFIQAQTNEEVSRVTLADLLSVRPEDITIDANGLLQLPPTTPDSFGAGTTNPISAAEKFRIQFTQAQLQQVERSYVPHFTMQSSISGRGSGANVDGSVQGGTVGLGIDRHNWAAGISVTFSAFDFFSIRSRAQISSANLRAEQAHYDQVLQDLNAQVEKARAGANGARLVAQNTPAELQAATDAEKQARARYQAGLTSIVEVSEAEALLVQAQMDDALARLNAWRALSGLAAAQGSLQPFLDALASPGGH